MQHVYLPVKTTSPIAIRSDHAEGGDATTSSIPGTTLLGSLAAAHRILRPEQEEEFVRLFLNEHIFFPSLYPAVFNPSKMGIEGANVPVIPLPKTAQSCKRFPGFRPLKGEITDNMNEKRHGIRDSLLDWATFALLDREQQAIPALLAPLEQHAFCIDCKQPLDHVSGYYRQARGDSKQRMKAKSSTRLQTHTGINRDWGIVEENILYNREVFDEGMLFWGEVLLSEEEVQTKVPLVDVFTTFVKEASNEGLIRIGTGRTRGLGNIEEIKKLFTAKREDSTSFKNRLHTFNRTVKSQAQKAGVKTLDPFYFAITLYSATILCDPFMRYCKGIDAVTLGRLLEYPSRTFKKIYQSTSMQCITGWNELWGTPRTNEYAMEMGSTFLFACSHELDDRLLQALYMLEETGIGRRRSEGFGRICISDHFHLEGEQL